MDTDLVSAAEWQAAILQGVERVLGRIDMIGDRSMSHGEALVLDVADRSGVGWIAKATRQRVHFERELLAYLNWVPVLGDRAPLLRHADDDLRLLVLSRLPGEPVDRSIHVHEPAVFEQAGRLLRLFHDSARQASDHKFVDRLRARAESYVFRSQHLVDAQDLAFVGHAVDELLDGPSLATVPCHRDYQPRNWLVHEGMVRVIDFGHADHDLWTVDMGRMYFGEWADQPDLQEAFFAGYGRVPHVSDWRIFRQYSAFGALTTIVWAHEHDDPAFERHGREMLARLQRG
jgi:Phosphotransferase enzyme family